MTLKYLLDTNIVSDLARNPQGVIADQISSVGESSVCTSIIVSGELRYGAEKSGSKALVDRVEIILSAIEVLSFTAPADRHYGKLRQQLTTKGTPIGPNDLLIASHALSEKLIIVTANTREFSRVPGLIVENWFSELEKR